SDAQVCRMIWNDAGGVILARAHASVIGRAWREGFQGEPSALVGKTAFPHLPAARDLNSATPSSLRKIWRPLPLLLVRTWIVPLSGLKSEARSAASSPYRAPVASAACAKRRKSGSLALSSGLASAIVRYRTRAPSASSKGSTRRQASSDEILPSRHARLSPAFKTVRVRFALARRRRIASTSPLASSRKFGFLASFLVRRRAGEAASSR